MTDHPHDVTRMSSCFWSLLSLPDYAFLYLPTSIMNTTVDHHPIKTLLLGKSLIDLIHPDERNLAKQDFNKFTHITSLAGAVTRCRLRKLDCIAKYDLSEQTSDLDWIIVDVIMYTASENIILAFFHCDQGYPACPHVQCDQESETKTNEIQDLSSLFQRYNNGHVPPLQEQSIGTLRAFQLYNNVTQTNITTWPSKQHLPPSYEDIVDAIQYDFHQALLQHRHDHPLFLPCTRHMRSTSNLTLERHGSLRFEKILIHYGQLTFAVFQILPTNRTSRLSSSPPPHVVPQTRKRQLDNCQSEDLHALQTPPKEHHSHFKDRTSLSTCIPSKSWRIKPNEKKKCESCQTSQSPEWRRGPSGHRTLCNACGLRYSRSLARQEHRNTLSPIISHTYAQQSSSSSLSEELSLISSSSSSSSSTSSSPSLPHQYHPYQLHPKYPGQRRVFNLYP
ncbi:hypothetical protein BC941DRAFT_516963 [Chlamydoabsidia padenii]|nr:hypothetical protein BC941DRAFT_516963 [Chlamydoabsidia padenii]